MIVNPSLFTADDMRGGKGGAEGKGAVGDAVGRGRWVVGGQWGGGKGGAVGRGRWAMA